MLTMPDTSDKPERGKGFHAQNIFFTFKRQLTNIMALEAE